MPRGILVLGSWLWFMSAMPGFGQEGSTRDVPSAATARKQANAAYQEKDYKTCARRFAQAASSGNGATVKNDSYNAACCHARAGNLDDAFEMLERSVEAGYRKLNQIKGEAGYSQNAV